MHISCTSDFYRLSKLTSIHSCRFCDTDLCSFFFSRSRISMGRTKLDNEPKSFMDRNSLCKSIIESGLRHLSHQLASKESSPDANLSPNYIWMILIGVTVLKYNWRKYY